jgi:hypothetical protein
VSIVLYFFQLLSGNCNLRCFAPSRFAPSSFVPKSFDIIKSFCPQIIIRCQSCFQGPSLTDNWGKGLYIHIFMFCLMDSFWKRLFLQYVNMNIHPPIMASSYGPAWLFCPPKNVYDKAINIFCKNIYKNASMNKLHSIYSSLYF